MSPHKEGKHAGKIGLVHLAPILEQCSQFKFSNVQDMNHRVSKYFSMLDQDKDTWVSFHDFLWPLLPILPPEVSTIFTQESRHKTHTFGEIRHAFDLVKDGDEASVKAIAAKLAEKPDPQGKILL